jgi:flotillin
MENIMTTIWPILPIGAIIILVIAILASGYLKAPPDTAYVISGVRKKPRILVGQAGIRIPFFERVDKLALGAIQIDVKTKTAVPTAEYINVKVDSTVSVRVGKEPEMIALAAQNFLNVNRDTIASKINDLLEGNIREIVGAMKLTEMVSDRKSFSDKVQNNVVPDLARFGLELVSFNVQNFFDENGVIENLGIDNVEQIRKNAAIAKSDAQREISIAEAENAKVSNDAKVKAAEEIAKRNNDLAIKQAELKQESDTKKAQADAAMAIEAENQRKAQEIATANANLARQEKEIELKEREVAVKEKTLEAEIKKTAEAQKFAEQQKADAKLYATQKAAEADLFERQRQAEAAMVEAEKKAAADLALAEADAKAKKALAEALEVEGKAKAAAAQALGLAEAEAIRAKAEAEAKGMLEKAAALKEYGDAARQQMELDAVKVLYEQLPAIAEAIGRGYAGADIHLIGSDSGQLAGNMMGNITQIIEGFKGATGVDPMSVISGMLGAKITENQ